jgi:hypothetical protein
MVGLSHHGRIAVNSGTAAAAFSGCHATLARHPQKDDNLPNRIRSPW